MSGAVPPPAARPLERAARVPRPVCPGCGRCGRVDPAPAPQRAPLRAGVARCGGGGRASPGGVPSAVVRGAWCQALSLPRPPVLWSGQPGFRCACVFVCVLCLAGSGGPASRARSGAPHLFLWPLCRSTLLGPLRAGVAPLSLAAAAFPRCPGPWFFFFFFFFFFVPLPLPGWLVSPAWPLAARWWLLPHLPPRLCPAVFVAAPWCPGGVFFFFFFFLVFFFFFFFFFFPLPVLLSPCAPVVSCFLWFPAPVALGLGAWVVCFVGLPLLGSPCACSSFVLSAWLLAAPSWLLPPPPPLLFLVVSVAAARCSVPCCAVCGWVLRCCALCRPVLCCPVPCCARLVPLLVAPCPLALPVALGPCALRRRVLRRSPALCALCCVCFVVARWCVLLFAALLCAVCVPGCCAVRSLCSPLCAVLCFAVLVRSRCAVRVVRAVAGACGALLCVVLFPVVCRGAVLVLLARGCLLVACFGVGVPVWPLGLLPCGWCGLLWCPVFLCRVLWCCAVAWRCAVALCCLFAVLLGLALPFCGLSRCAVLCCWLVVLFFARWWCLRAVVLFPSCPGAVLPRGAVVSCPVALLGLFLAWVWLYLLEKPLLNFV